MTPLTAREKPLVDVAKATLEFYQEYRDTEGHMTQQDCDMEAICRAYLRQREAPTDEELEEHLRPADECRLDFSEWDEGFREGVRWAKAMQRVALKEDE